MGPMFGHGPHVWHRLHQCHPEMSVRPCCEHSGWKTSESDPAFAWTQRGRHGLTARIAALASVLTPLHHGKTWKNTIFHECITNSKSTPWGSLGVVQPLCRNNGHRFPAVHRPERGRPRVACRGPVHMLRSFMLLRHDHRTKDAKACDP